MTLNIQKGSEDMADLDTAGRYAVSTMPGIAFRYAGPQIERYWDNSNDEPEWDDWAERETGMVLMVMVGDDYEHVVDPEDIERIDEDEYCSDCGQIGCGWG